MWLRIRAFALVIFSANPNFRIHRLVYWMTSTAQTKKKSWTANMTLSISLNHSKKILGRVRISQQPKIEWRKMEDVPKDLLYEENRWINKWTKNKFCQSEFDGNMQCELYPPIWWQFHCMCVSFIRLILSTLFLSVFLRI